MDKKKYDNRYYDEDDHLPKGAIEMPSEGEEFDSKLHTYTSNYNKGKGKLSDNKSLEKESANLQKNNIIELKQRLNNLEAYKNLCEKRIRQLVPTHTLPVKESDLKNVTDPHKDKKSNSQYLHSIIESKDTEIALLNKKIQILESKSKVNDSEPKLKSNRDKPSKFEFPNYENIPMDRIKDAYTRLYNYARDLSRDKEYIMESFRNETINNEQQRNYIEILKQTLESNIVKHGLGPVLHSCKQGRDISSIDILCDISKANSESEKYRKELIVSQVLITELKQEVEYLKKLNEDINIKKERMKETVDIGIIELDQARDRIKTLEEEKEQIESTFEEFKSFSDKLRSDLSDSLSIINKLEKELNEKDRKIYDLTGKLENQQLIKNNSIELDKKLKKLNDDYEKVIKDKVTIQTVLSNREDNLKDRDGEIYRIQNIMNENNIIYEQEKRSLLDKNDILNREITKHEKNNNSLSVKLSETELENKRINDKLNLSERSLKEYRIQHENLKSTYDEYKRNTERELDHNLRTIKELNINLSATKEELNNIKNDKDSLYSNNLQLNSDLKRLDNEHGSLLREYNLLKNNNSKLNDEFTNVSRRCAQLDDENEILKVDLDTLNGDYNYLRDKYEKDINIKNEELSILNNESNMLKREKNLLNGQVNELKESNNSNIYKLENSNEVLKNKDNQINELRVKESENINVIENLNRRLELLSNEKDDALNDLNYKNSKLNELNNIRVNLESQLSDKEKSLYASEEIRRDILNELKEISHRAEDLHRKLEKTHQDLDKEMKINYELSNNVNLLNLKVEQLEKDNKQLFEERNQLENLKRRLSDDNELLKNVEKDNQNSLINLGKINHDLRSSLISLNNSNKTNIHRFTLMCSDNNEYNFSQNFKYSLSNYEQFLSDTSEKRIPDIARYAQDWTKSLSTELELFYEKIKANNEVIKDTSNKIKNLDYTLKDMSHREENIKEELRKANNQIKAFSNETSLLGQEKASLEAHIDRLNREIRNLNSDLLRINEELEYNKNENSQLKELSEEISKDNNDKYKLLQTYNFQIDSLEERIVILIKEKEYLENLLEVISKAFPSSDMHRLMNEILNENDELSQLEREKIKVNNEISQLEMELKHLEQPPQEIISAIKTELDQMRGILYDINKKLNEKKMKLNSLEMNISKIESNEKTKLSLVNEYNNRIKQLEKELDDKNNLKFHNRTQSTDFRQDGDTIDPLRLSSSFMNEARYSNTLLNSGYRRGYSENY